MYKHTDDKIDALYKIVRIVHFLDRAIVYPQLHIRRTESSRIADESPNMMSFAQSAGNGMSAGPACRTEH